MNSQLAWLPGPPSPLPLPCLHSSWIYSQKMRFSLFQAPYISPQAPFVSVRLQLVSEALFRGNSWILAALLDISSGSQTARRWYSDTQWSSHRFSILLRPHRPWMGRWNWKDEFPIEICSRRWILDSPQWITSGCIHASSICKLPPLVRWNWTDSLCFGTSGGR